MPSSQIERKLAAIMFTDIAGYTALSAKDETKALNLLDTQKQILTPIIEEFNGTLHKEMGDGLLFTFPTVTGAVKCGIKIQEETKANDVLNLRVGIHEGEITLKDGDALGDDVNVASRIEAFAPSGGIAISSKVQQNISSLPEFETTYVGTPKLKGVPQEVKVYCITSHGLPQTDISKVSAKLEEEEVKSRFNIFTLTGGILTTIGIAFWISVGVFDVSFGSKVEVPSIGILMMENLGKEDEEFWSSVMTADLITKVKGAGLIRVASLDDILNLDKNLNIEEKAKKLRVKYILTHSFLIKDNGFELWSTLENIENGVALFSNKISEPLDMTTQMVGKLANDIITSLKVETKQDIMKAPTNNADAYEYYLKGRYQYIKQKTDEDISIAKELLRKAIDLDDNLIDAKVWLGRIYQDKEDNNKALNIFEEGLKKSRELGDSIGVAGCLIGIGDVQLALGKTDSAIMCYKKAIEIEGEIGDKRVGTRLKIGACMSRSLFDDIESQLNYYKESLAIAREIEDSTTIAKTLMWMGNINKNNGKFDIAEKNYNQAIKIYKLLDDKNKIVWGVQNLGFVYSQNGNPKKALYYFKKALEIAEETNNSNDIAWLLRLLADSYYKQGDFENSLEYYTRSLKINEEIGDKYGIGYNLRNIGIVHYYKGEYGTALDYYGRSLKIVEELGNKRGMGYSLNCIGIVCWNKGDYKMAEEYLDKSLAIRKEIGIGSNLELTTYRYITYKHLGKQYDVKEIHSLIKDDENIEFELNLRLYELLDDTSYLETAYNQIQELADNLEPDVAAKFLSYPIPATIVEEWDKIK